MTKPVLLPYVILSPGTKVDRLGFCQLGPKGNLLFVAELAPEPGAVAQEMVAEAAKEKALARRSKSRVEDGR